MTIDMAPTPHHFNVDDAIGQIPDVLVGDSRLSPDDLSPERIDDVLRGMGHVLVAASADADNGDKKTFNSSI